jgi:hypothetical protein
VKYRDLPESGNPNMACLNDACEQFAVLYSATRGDYFMAYDYLDVNCGGCGQPMHLVREVRTLEVIE